MAIVRAGTSGVTDAERAGAVAAWLDCRAGEYADSENHRPAKADACLGDPSPTHARCLNEGLKVSTEPGLSIPPPAFGWEYGYRPEGVGYRSHNAARLRAGN